MNEVKIDVNTDEIIGSLYIQLQGQRKYIEVLTAKIKQLEAENKELGQMVKLITEPNGCGAEMERPVKTGVINGQD